VNTSGGARLSRTFLSGAVGLRGDALFFDDIDDPARVKSAAYRAERDLKLNDYCAPASSWPRSIPDGKTTPAKTRLEKPSSD
jgi:hypothetical protein